MAPRSRAERVSPVTTAILYVTLTTGLYYLMARAKVTQAIWSRYPSWLDYWATCAACAGFWYGIACGVLGVWLDLPLFGLDPDHPVTVLSAGILGMVWTPIVAFVMVYGWERLTPGDDDADADELEDGDDEPPLRAV